MAATRAAQRRSPQGAALGPKTSNLARSPHVTIAPVAHEVTLDVDLSFRRPHEDAVVLVRSAHDAVRCERERSAAPGDPTTVTIEVHGGIAGAECADVVGPVDDFLQCGHHVPADAAALQCRVHSHAFDVTGAQRRVEVDEAALDYRSMTDDL